jgi:hypothetical protein
MGEEGLAAVRPPATLETVWTLCRVRAYCPADAVPGPQAFLKNSGTRYA